MRDTKDKNRAEGRRGKWKKKRKVKEEEESKERRDKRDSERCCGNYIETERTRCKNTSWVNVLPSSILENKGLKGLSKRSSHRSVYWDKKSVQRNDEASWLEGKLNEIGSQAKKGWKTDDEGWTLEVAKVIQVYSSFQRRVTGIFGWSKTKTLYKIKTLKKKSGDLFKHKICINEKKQRIKAWLFQRMRRRLKAV